MRTTITCLLICFVLYGEAQLLSLSDTKSYKNSYFISFDNDTIYGEVQYANSLFSNRMRKIYFIDLDGYKYTLKAKESNGFMMNGKFYTAKIVDEMYYFLRPAVTGSPALYVLEKNYVGKERNSLAMIRSDENQTKVIDRYVETKGRMNKIYPKRFKKQAPQLFSSYPDVIAMIQNDEFTFDDIEEIVVFCNYSNDGLSDRK